MVKQGLCEEAQVHVLDSKGHLTGTGPLCWQELGCDALVGQAPEQHQTWLRLPLSEAVVMQIRWLLSLGQGFAGRREHPAPSCLPTWSPLSFRDHLFQEPLGMKSSMSL